MSTKSPTKEELRERLNAITRENATMVQLIRGLLVQHSATVRDHCSRDAMILCAKEERDDTTIEIWGSRTFSLGGVFVLVQSVGGNLGLSFHTYSELVRLQNELHKDNPETPLIVDAIETTREQAKREMSEGIKV